MAAARLGDLETLRSHRDQLLDEFEEYPYHVWMAAFETDQVSVLDLCLEAGLDPDGTSAARPLLEAAASRAKLCVQRLLECGADPRLADEDGRDLLLVAVSHQDLEMVRKALDGGANPFGENLDFYVSLAPKELASIIREARTQIKDRLAPVLAVAKSVSKGGAIETQLNPEDINTPLYPEKGSTLMHLAARADNAAALRALVAMGGNIDVLDRTVHERKFGRGTVLELSSVIGGWTPLMVACRQGNDSAIRTLLELGADVHYADAKGEAALHLACRRGKASIVEMLLDAGADPHAVTEEGATPLLIAGYFGSASVARRLLEAGAVVDQADDDGVTPFLAACWEGRTEIAELLLQNGAQVDAKSQEGDVWDALHAERRTKTLMRLLTHLDLNPEGREASPLATAVSCFHLEVIPAMVAAGAQLKPGEQVNLTDVWGVTPAVHEAAIKAMATLTGGVALDALYLAARSDNLELVRSLLAMGAALQGPPPAIAQGLRPKLIRLLLDHGADIDARDASGKTALAWAVLHENLEAAKLLLERGADPLVADEDGYRPVDLAMIGSSSFRRLFARYKPDTARVASLRLSQLFSEYEPPKPADVADALDQGGDPNLKVGRGYDLLSVAAATRNWEAAELLLAAGASPNWMVEVLLAIRDLPARASDEFRASVAEIERALGEEAVPIEKGFGAVAFRLEAQVTAMRDQLMAEGHNATVADLRASMETAKRVAETWAPAFTSGWCGSWRCHPVANERLMCVPTRNPYEVVALIQPHAGEHDIGVFEILEFLRKHELLGWRLTGLGYDTVDLEFERLPSDMGAFAKELYEFCPDLIDQGFESLKMLEHHLRATRRVHFWWD